MGNTEEALIVANLGVPERGAKADGPWRRDTGTGWIRETRDHDSATTTPMPSAAVTR
jgi:hypothetical protein